MSDLIKVTANGTVIGDYWKNISEFEREAETEYAERRETNKRVEFYGNAEKMNLKNRKRKGGQAC